MRTSNWDAILASEPINRMAALAAAVGFSGDEETMLAKAKRDIEALEQGDPNFRNLVGLIKGRLTVVAYGGRAKRSTPGAQWIVRCKCGNYEVRRTRALREQNPNDRCEDCNQLQRLRLGCKNEVAA